MEPLQSDIVTKVTHGNTRKSHISDDPIVKYINEHSLRLEPVQKKLIDITLKHSMSSHLGSADQIQLLQNLCRVINAKKTLDIGVYTGYSAVSIAMVLPPDGVVVACDTTEEYANMGKPLWKEAGVLHKIDLRIAPAKETLIELVESGEGESFDFAFIDADKEQYDDYYELCIKLVRPGGIIAVDNMLWGGQVIDPKYTDNCTKSIRVLGRKMAVDERINVSFVDIGDGTMLAFKK